MFDESVIVGLKKRYNNLHPLIFQRSVERAKTLGELFDILDMCPHIYPIVWSDDKKCWITTKDLVQANRFDLRREK